MCDLKALSKIETDKQKKTILASLSSVTLNNKW